MVEASKFRFFLVQSLYNTFLSQTGVPKLKMASLIRNVLFKNPCILPQNESFIFWCAWTIFHPILDDEIWGISQTFHANPMNSPFLWDPHPPFLTLPQTTNNDKPWSPRCVCLDFSLLLQFRANDKTKAFQGIVTCRSWDNRNPGWNRKIMGISKGLLHEEFTGFFVYIYIMGICMMAYLSWFGYLIGIIELIISMNSD